MVELKLIHKGYLDQGLIKIKNTGLPPLPNLYEHSQEFLKQRRTMASLEDFFNAFRNPKTDKGLVIDSLYVGLITQDFFNFEYAMKGSDKAKVIIHPWNDSSESMKRYVVSVPFYQNESIENVLSSKEGLAFLVRLLGETMDASETKIKKRINTFTEFFHYEGKPAQIVISTPSLSERIANPYKSLIMNMDTGFSDDTKFYIKIADDKTTGGVALEYIKQ